MIEKWFTRGLEVVLFLLVLVEELDTWWSELRHHRRCARDG